MDNIAIRVEGLGKRYWLSQQSAPKYRTLREDLVAFFRSPHRRLKKKVDSEEFWALRDVSFEIRQGEVLGVIGRNGAGKSTLLKILSRIVEPTAGQVDIYGRIGSLLEVGTGFHPELTGRENVFLSGAILGMRRHEVKSRFDEIVAFAEIERFIDTPCKHYSSGMYMKLAFAVAAHLEPEILIIDEVLAVGDAAFQQKCLGKMSEISQRDARTIIFVSHNMAAIQSLCSRAILLKSGKISIDAPVDACIREYSASIALYEFAHTVDLRKQLPGRLGDQNVSISKLLITDSQSASSTEFAFGEPFEMTVYLRANVRLREFILGFSINTLEGLVIVCSNHYDLLPVAPLEIGEHIFTVKVENIWLSPGVYSLTWAISSGDQQGPHDFIPDCAKIRVEARGSSAQANSKRRLDNRPGLTRPPLNWTQH